MIGIKYKPALKDALVNHELGSDLSDVSILSKRVVGNAEAELALWPGRMCLYILFISTYASFFRCFSY